MPQSSVQGALLDACVTHSSGNAGLGGGRTELRGQWPVQTVRPSKLRGESAIRLDCSCCQSLSGVHGTLRLPGWAPRRLWQRCVCLPHLGAGGSFSDSRGGNRAV